MINISRFGLIVPFLTTLWCLLTNVFLFSECACTVGLYTAVSSPVKVYLASLLLFQGSVHSIFSLGLFQTFFSKI